MVQRIAHAVWPVAYGNILSPAQLEFMLDRMYSETALAGQFKLGHTFLIASEGPDHVGFASYETGYQEQRTCRIHKLYVLPDRQGNGIGSHLLAAIETAALAADNGRLNLNVNRFNPAKEFYARRGFAVVRSEVIDIGQGYVMDDHVMELIIQR